MCALRETKLKGRGEEVVKVAGERTKEGVALLLSEWLLRSVVEWKGVSSRLMWVRVTIERESWELISAYRRGSERSKKEIEEFRSELRECVGSFGRNESVVVLGDLNARV